jgi:hypothetical protein
MKITVEIDNEAIEQNVTELVSKQLAAELYKELRGSRDMSLTYRYHVEVRKIIREVLKENYDALAKEAISAAAKSIESRALKERIKAALEE